MNDNHSQYELKYKVRWLASLLRDAVREHPVIILTGARQVGKSTLLLQEPPFSGWRYVSMDDFDALAQAKKDPASLWAGVDRIVIDEVQKSTNLLEAVKIAVDSQPDKYRFVLSGSANLLLMKKVSETLAGRAVFFTLNPLTIGEMKNQSPSHLLKNLFQGKLPEKTNISSKPMNPFHLMWKGFMPSLIRLQTPAAILRWWEGYITT